jgi:hypothetical protein
MKTYLSFFFVAITIISNAAVITWDGEGADGLWNTSSNWVGDRIPGPADDVVLDNSIFPGNYNVSLPNGLITTEIQSLLISPGAGNSILLLIPATNTADPGLRVSGSGDAVVLNNRAVLKNSSGASVGPGLLIVAVFRINNGGRYIHNTSRAHTPVLTQLSTAAGTESGVFEYDVPAASYTISLSNRIYGTLELSSLANNGMVRYIGSGVNAVNIMGDFKINTGVSVSINMSADFFVHGNYIQSASSVFDIQNGNAANFIKMRGGINIGGVITETGSGFPVIELNGLINQPVLATGQLLNSISLKINNAAGITLLSPLMLPYNLDLANGRIKTDLVNLLTMVDNAVYTGGSVISFVEGPMKKNGDEDFYFPIGQGQVYAPLGLTGGVNASTSDQFTAGYTRANPQTSYGINFEASPPPVINHISYVEYWNVTSNTGNAVSKNLVLKVNCESFCRDASTLLVASYIPATAQWRNTGQSGNSSSGSILCPGYITGTVTAGPVNDFKAFVLATSDVYTVNPLPVELISFNVTRIDAGKAAINWEMAHGYSSRIKFEIQQAGKEKQFKTIGMVNGNESSVFYTLEDGQLQPGINYYRLKIIDPGRDTVYGRIVSVVNENKDLYLVSLFPVPVSSKMTLSLVCSTEQALEIHIVDMHGRLIMKQFHRIRGGNTAIEIDAGMLRRGIYQLVGVTKNGRTNTLRVIKE